MKLIKIYYQLLKNLKKSRKVSANCYIDTKIFTLYGKQHQVLVIVESIEKSILLLITQNYLFKESYVVPY